MDDKATLELPRTDFSMRANLPQREAGRPGFILHDGPPYPNAVSVAHGGLATRLAAKAAVLREMRIAGLAVEHAPGAECEGCGMSSEAVGRERVA